MQVAHHHNMSYVTTGHMPNRDLIRHCLTLNLLELWNAERNAVFTDTVEAEVSGSSLVIGRNIAWRF